MFINYTNRILRKHYKSLELNIKDKLFPYQEPQFTYIVNLLKIRLNTRNIEEIIPKFINTNLYYFDNGKDIYKTYNHVKRLNNNLVEEEIIEILNIVLLNDNFDGKVPSTKEINSKLKEYEIKIKQLINANNYIKNKNNIVKETNNNNPSESYNKVFNKVMELLQEHISEEILIKYNINIKIYIFLTLTYLYEIKLETRFHYNTEIIHKKITDIIRIFSQKEEIEFETLEAVYIIVKEKYQTGLKKFGKDNSYIELITLSFLINAINNETITSMENDNLDYLVKKISTVYSKELINMEDYE